MKTIILLLIMITIPTVTKADVIINTLFKYGVNGYTQSGVNQNMNSTVTSTEGKGKKDSTTITNNLSNTNSGASGAQYGVTPGVGLQVVPRYDGLSIGAGYYFDNTIQMSLGWKL